MLVSGEWQAQGVCAIDGPHSGWSFRFSAIGAMTTARAGPMPLSWSPHGTRSSPWPALVSHSLAAAEGLVAAGLRVRLDRLNSVLTDRRTFPADTYPNPRPGERDPCTLTGQMGTCIWYASEYEH